MFYIIWAAIIIPLAVCGLLMRRGRGLMLLAGYNTLPKAEREKIDKNTLGRMAGNMLLRMAAEFLLMGIAFAMEMPSLAMFFMVLFGVDILLSIIRINKQMQTERRGKAGMVLAVIVLAITFVLVGVLFYFGEKEPEIICSTDALEIKCMFGTSIAFGDIESVQLDERSMDDIAPDARRTNGYGGFGDALKGSFSDSGSSLLLYVYSGSSPTIAINTTDGKIIYISMNNPGDTITHYEEIYQAIHGTKPQESSMLQNSGMLI